VSPASAMIQSGHRISARRRPHGQHADPAGVPHRVRHQGPLSFADSGSPSRRNSWRCWSVTGWRMIRGICGTDGLGTCSCTPSGCGGLGGGIPDLGLKPQAVPLDRFAIGVADDRTHRSTRFGVRRHVCALVSCGAGAGMLLCALHCTPRFDSARSAPIQSGVVPPHSKPPSPGRAGGAPGY